MTWVDGVILGVLAISALLAFLRGLVHEVLGVGAWLGAAVAGFAAQPYVEPWIRPYVDNPPWLPGVIAALIVFILVLILLKIIAGSIAALVQSSALGGLDRTLGVLFGLARGAFMVVLAYILAGLAMPATERWPVPVLQARSLPLAADGARWLMAQLPEQYRRPLPAAPASATPTQDDLLRPPARNRI